MICSTPGTEVSMVPSRLPTGTTTVTSGDSMCSWICAMTCAASECSRCAGATTVRRGDIEALRAESTEASVVRICASTVDTPRLDMKTRRCPSTPSMPRIVRVAYMSTVCTAGVSRTPNLSMASVSMMPHSNVFSADPVVDA